MLREKGALALRDQLHQTRPFVEVLFLRERDAETLDTPERRAGLKARLRNAASAIADRDLADQYRGELLRRFDTLVGKIVPQAGAMGSARAPWRKGGLIPPQAPTAEGRAAAQTLARSLNPLASAVALGEH